MHKWKEFFIGSLIFICSSMISGGIISYVITLLISFITYWIPFSYKILITIFLLILFILHEFKIIKLKLIQNHWQVPANWVNFKTKGNMLIWGSILGGGIFTYIPNVSFYLLFIVLSFFVDPVNSILFGFIYGFSRTIPTILYALFKEKRFNKESNDYLNIRNFKKYNKVSSLVICFLFLFFLLFVLQMDIILAS